jgi:hypothetical protein
MGRISQKFDRQLFTLKLSELACGQNIQNELVRTKGGHLMSDSAGPPEKKPWMTSGRSLYRTHAERMPMDLFSYTREALHCLDQRRFLATIAMASTAVELILNRDRRLREPLSELRGAHGWANLNNRTLRIAREKGLPVEALMSDGDNLDSDTPVAFVELRNKVAHGEITHLVTDLSDYDPEAARMAAEQESKMRHFVSSWYNTAPDVQDGRIRKNRWPDTI